MTKQGPNTRLRSLRSTRNQVFAEEPNHHHDRVTSFLNNGLLKLRPQAALSLSSRSVWALLSSIESEAPFDAACEEDVKTMERNQTILPVVRLRAGMAYEGIDLEGRLAMVRLCIL